MNRTQPHKPYWTLISGVCAFSAVCVLAILAVQWWRGDNATFEYTFVYNDEQVILGGLGDGFGVVNYRSIRVGNMAPQGSPLSYLSNSAVPPLLLFINEETFTVGNITVQDLKRLGAKIDESQGTEQTDVWYILKPGNSVSIRMADGKPISAVLSYHGAYDGSMPPGVTFDDPIYFAIKGSQKMCLPVPHKEIEDALGDADAVYKNRIWLKN
jgi:hypothetical protein